MYSAIRPTRRSFLAATAAVAFPAIIPARVFGANDRVITGHIGVGGQGTSNLKAFLKNAGALCDVDSNRLSLAAKVVAAIGSPCDTFSDYRKLLDRKDIDAVVISTPDHWHALTTIHACQAGKDVYCEKPLSLTIAEGRAMVEAARKHKRVVQTGSQQRSSGEFRTACELVRSGKIGGVKSILVGLPASNFASPAVPDSEPPAELDYDFWLGPAPTLPYNAKRVHYNFRFFWDYSGGQMTNFGAHHIDIAQWALNMDDSGPISTEGTATFDPKHEYEVTSTCRVTHTYADGVTLVVGQLEKDIPGGLTFLGTGGSIRVDRGKVTSTIDEIVKSNPPVEDVHLEVSTNHHANFLDCIKTRKQPIADVSVGHRSATVCHLGNIAIRLGRKVQWDPSAEKFVGDEEANRMISRPYRSPWAV
ncbi:MAG: oxidoreductase domain protein [Planctomycetota bacterium]|nr:oxidoreductase domain protein [Planctomycetota bacterium]